MFLSGKAPIPPALLGLFIIGLLAPQPTGAEPWQPLHDVEVPSTIRRATYGWIFEDFDSGSDPVLSSPVTSSTVWANGLVDKNTPIIRTGLDFPMGGAQFNLRLLAGQSKRSGLDGRLITDEIDTNSDSFSDLLIWRRTASGLPDSEQDGNLALRTGLRWPTWGIGASFSRERGRAFPDATQFAFPTTGASVSATGQSVSVFNLDSGEQISSRDFESRLSQTDERLVWGVDMGARFKALALAIGIGFERQTFEDTASGILIEDVNGNLSEQEATRDFVQTERAILTALRFDGRHEIGPDRHFLWTAGMRVRKPTALGWTGTEELDTTASGLAGDVEQAWIRELENPNQDATQVDARIAMGLADEGPLFRYGFGVDWRVSSLKSSLNYRDNLTFRVADSGIPGQRPASSLFAEGYGDWRAENADISYEYAIGGGGRYAVNQYLGLIMGSRIGYRQSEHRRTRTLVDTEPVSGERLTEPSVIDAIEVPYASFDVPDDVLREFSETFIDLNFGFTFHINRADLTTLFSLNDASDLTVIVEGVWRW